MPSDREALVHDLMGSAKFTLLGKAEPRDDDDVLYERFAHIVALAAEPVQDTSTPLEGTDTREAYEAVRSLVLVGDELYAAARTVPGMSGACTKWLDQAPRVAALAGCLRQLPASSQDTGGGEEREIGEGEWLMRTYAPHLADPPVAPSPTGDREREARRAVDRLVSGFTTLIETCETADRTPRYEEGEARADGEPAEAPNARWLTPREAASHWRGAIRIVLADLGRALDAPAASPSPTGGEPDARDELIKRLDGLHDGLVQMGDAPQAVIDEAATLAQMAARATSTRVEARLPQSTGTATEDAIYRGALRAIESGRGSVATDASFAREIARAAMEELPSPPAVPTGGEGDDARLVDVISEQVDEAKRRLLGAPASSAREGRRKCLACDYALPVAMRSWCEMPEGHAGQHDWQHDWQGAREGSDDA